jgi:phosphocarrier protein
MPSEGSPGVSREVSVCNARGLHARASAKFVKLASQYDAEVTVTKDGQTVEAQSIMGLMMLAAGPGCAIEIAAEGPQAAEAVDALVELVSGRFEEDA